MTPALATNTTLALRVALLDGAGTAIMPRFAVEEALAAGRLVPVLRPWHLSHHAAHALFPGGGYVPVKTRRFVDLLIAHRKQLVDENT